VKELCELFEEKMPGSKVDKINWSNPRNFQYNFMVNYSFSNPDIGTEVGNLILIDPVPLSKLKNHEYTSEQRYQDIWYKYPQSQIDSTIIEFPKNFRVTSFPEPVVLNKGFAVYVTNFANTDSCLILTRILMYKDSIIPREKYQEIRDFHDQIIAADGRQIVLERMN
jgi:hypothetical protein